MLHNPNSNSIKNNILKNKNPYTSFRKEKYGRDMQPPEMDGGKALQSLMS